MFLELEMQQKREHQEDFTSWVVLCSTLVDLSCLTKASAVHRTPSAAHIQPQKWPRTETLVWMCYEVTGNNGRQMCCKLINSCSSGSPSWGKAFSRLNGTLARSVRAIQYPCPSLLSPARDAVCGRTVTVGLSVWRRWRCPRGSMGL